MTLPEPATINLPKRLASPATRALAGAGITHLEQLAQFSEAALLNLHGIGPRAIGQLRETMAAHGLAFTDQPVTAQQTAGTVLAVCSSAAHTFSKPTQPHIHLIAGEGVAGDAHRGETVKHRSRVAQDPTQPNLRQVHLIHAELHDELNQAGFNVAAGQMGENITTRGIDLLGLPTGTRLHLGASAIVEITGLRNPCVQLDHFQHGLMAAVLDRDEQGNMIRKAGIMGIVLTGGTVAPGDAIRVDLPAQPHRPLERV